VTARQSRPACKRARARVVDRAFDDFTAWTESYLNARSSEHRAATESVGVELAEKRRAVLYELIQSDPASAIGLTVAEEVADRLPDAVATSLATRIRGNGAFIVNYGCGPEGCQTVRQVAYQGRLYVAFVYGGGAKQTTYRNIYLEGIAVGDRIAVASGCLANPRVVAGESDSLASMPTFVTRHGQPLLRPWTFGTNTVLYMRLDYPDAPGATLGMAAAAQQLVVDASKFYAANTYGRIPSLPATVTPVLRMPSLYGSYASREEVEQDATTVGIAAGFDPAIYDLVVFQNTPQQVMSGFWGFARENAKGVWMYNGFNWMHHSHEFGHNFGNRHANLWDSEGVDPIGPGTNLEYGDVFDNMGNQGHLGQGHHHPWFKNRQDWLDDNEITTVTTNGAHRVQALEFAPGGDWMALKIRRDQIRNYWIFYRNQFPQSQNGAIISWGYNQRVSAHLLDMTPGSAIGLNDAWDAPLLVGQTFFDWAANIQVSVLNRPDTIPPSLDVDVVLGPPNNASPLVDAGSNAVIVLTGESVTVNLDGNVTDPDDTPETLWAAEGGVLFGDPQLAATTATFTQPGFFELGLNASDGVNPPVSDAVSIAVVPPAGRAILLNSPVGGESWTEGASATVTWSSAGITSVMIELSRDGGSTWETLANTAPAAGGSWTWKSVTSPASNRCLIRASDAAGPASENPVSVSRDYFTITTAACSPNIPGDLDCDGDVDLDDFVLWSPCLAGPGVVVSPQGCSAIIFTDSDLDMDSDVDLGDYALFTMALAGGGA